MNKSFCIILFFSLAFFQKVNSQNFCFTPTHSKKSNLEFRTLSANQASSYCLKIYVHVIRTSDGLGGQSESDVNEALHFLDIDFNTHNIYFDWDGYIDYIDDNRYFNNPGYSIYSVNNHNDGIDIYLFDDNAPSGGMANGVGGSSEFYVSGTYWSSPYGSLVKSHVMSHEMGHVLNLWHTHHQREIGCNEYVDGRNSSVCGDFVDDTPPDPFLNFNVDLSDCEWNGSANDPAGVPYNPDEKLIMSYSNIHCMSYFSNGQGQRMKNAIVNMPHLINAVVDCGENCENHLTIIENVNSGETDIQQASKSILASNTIENNAAAIYTAGESILLDIGFLSESGSIFEASIESCSGAQFDFADDTKQGFKSFDSFSLDNATDIDELKSPSFDLSVYPNPSNGHVNVVIDYINGEEYKVLIHNKIGDLIMVSTVDFENRSINLKGIKEDIYFISLYKADMMIGTTKLIRQN